MRTVTLPPTWNIRALLRYSLGAFAIFVIWGGFVISVKYNSGSSGDVGNHNTTVPQEESGTTPLSPPPPYQSPTALTPLQEDSLNEYPIAWAPMYYHERVWPHHKAHNTSCPRFLTGIGRIGAGLGHRLLNWMSHLTTAIMFNLTYVHTPWEWGVGTQAHSDTLEENEDVFLGLDINETLVDGVAGCKVVYLPGIVPSKTFAEEFADISKVMAAHADDCNVLFSMNKGDSDLLHRASHIVKWIAIAKYEAARRIHPLSTPLFSQTHFNIAVHIRVGDYRANDDSYFYNLLNGILAVLTRSCQLPIHIHIFSQNIDTINSFPKTAAIAPNDDMAQSGDWPGSSI